MAEKKFAGSAGNWGATKRGPRNRFTLAALTLAIILQLAPCLSGVWAGPPFVTDDPETVEYRHWEFYLATEYSNDRDGFSGTAPQLEVNYGVWPNVQLHLINRYSYIRPRGDSTKYGIGDTEIGVKYRFIRETDSLPQVGTFPLIELPTGDSSRALGSGHTQVFLPIWLQKSLGPWQTYGGGGYWRNPGNGNKDYWFFGWQAQRDLSKRLTVGAEIFHSTPSMEGGPHRTGFNVGAIINFSEEHHFIFSAGRDIHGDNLFSTYAAYLWTFGPSEKKDGKR
jgi:hypothetical protein